MLVVGLIALGVACHVQALDWGLFWDDYVHQYVLRNLDGSDVLTPWNLFDFRMQRTPQAQGSPWRLYFWWMDPGFGVGFLRPVSSLSTWLDYRLYGDWAPGYHVTSLAWFALFLWLAYRLYRAAGASLVAAAWALAFLALDDNHCMPVGWVANRNELLAATLVVATVLAVQRARGGRHAWAYGVLAVACALGASGAKESGLLALPLAVAFVMLSPDREEPLGVGAALRRAASSPVLWALTAAAGIFVVVFVAGGFGARSEGYPTPWLQPGRYSLNLAVHAPIAALGLLLGYPTDGLMLRPGLLPVVWVGAVVVVPAAGWLVLAATGRGRLVALGLVWVGLGLLVVGAVELSDRLLVHANVGSALLLGLFMERVWPPRKAWAGGRRAAAVLAVVLVATQLVGAAGLNVLRNAAIGYLAERDRAAVASAPLETPGDDTAQEQWHGAQRVYALNTPSGLLALSLGPTWNVTHEDRTSEFYPMQTAGRALRWERLDERTMTLTSEGVPFVTHVLERLARVGKPLRVDERLGTPAFDAVVVELADGGVRTVRFEFHEPLDGPENRFLVWEDGRFVRIAPPEVGAAVRIPEVERPVLAGP